MPLAAEPHTRESPVAKKPTPKPAGREPVGDKQINFRANPRLDARLNNVADALGLDVSNLVRLILNENLHTYEERAARVRAGGSD